MHTSWQFTCEQTPYEFLFFLYDTYMSVHVFSCQLFTLPTLPSQVCVGVGCESRGDSIKEMEIEFDLFEKEIQ